MDSKAQRNVHVVPHGDGWDVVHEGARGERAHFLNQDEAIEAATVIARREKVELLVHGQDGQIRMRNSYGHDPRDVRG
ncbi:DUF2188 domain-containing protein [Cupriavidus basilensis]|uniref:DUF2188 domain-containing protein n=1 Tax=Cupriavidus TaxID=106589 RepID=UPI000447A386|nr:MULTISPECIES: DUF2188 domain-containing protein [Cupriavidus]KDP87367.1 hypothetical protein CF70_001850 [Cupriavidus sp. SK-3]MDF3882177.1 DUF2188 domain-containing protein [Cupriavidus basilensis]